MRLDAFSNSDFDRGAGRGTEMAWLIVQAYLFSSWLPGSGWRRLLLRAFGAKVGQGVVIKPFVSIKFPWRLRIGDHVWLGERVWIDNLADIDIAAHSCISQGAYLCTGSHDWSDPKFALITKPITIGQGCWVGAKCSLAPDTTMEDNAILTMGTLGRGQLKADQIYLGDEIVRERPKGVIAK